jgi:hypothetical protein
MRLWLVTCRGFYQGNLRTLLTCMCLQFVCLHGRALKCLFLPFRWWAGSTDHRGTPHSSLEGPSRSSTSLEQLVYTLSHVHPPPLLL